MKKLFTIILVVLMSVSMLAGCGESGKNANHEIDKETNKEDNLMGNQNSEDDIISSEADDSEPAGNDENTNNDYANNDAFDISSYKVVEIHTSKGKKVKIYYNPQVILSWDVYDGESALYGHDTNGDTYEFMVNDATSAEEYAASFLSYNTHLEMKGQEELQMSGYTIHSFHLKEKDSDVVRTSLGVIELDSEVVCSFTYKHVHFGTESFEAVLGALKFIVES